MKRAVRVAVTASSLVEKIQALQSKHGDVPVRLDVLGAHGGFMQAGVDEVYFKDGDIVIEGDEEKNP